jgi:hypothetical protein
MKLEKFEDLLEMDTESLKLVETKRVLTRLKQLLKQDKVEEKIEEVASEDYPYVAVSAVGNSTVVLKFDLDSRKARVSEVTDDSRGGHMSFYNAQLIFNDKVKKQTKKGK